MLEDHADAPLARRKLGDVFPGDSHASLVQRSQPGDAAQQGRLAAAGRPQQGNELALGDVRMNILEDLGGTERLDRPCSCR